MLPATEYLLRLRCDAPFRALFFVHLRVKWNTDDTDAMDLHCDHPFDLCHPCSLLFNSDRNVKVSDASTSLSINSTNAEQCVEAGHKKKKSLDQKV